MTIDLQRVSKRYTHNWILKNVSYQFKSDVIYAIRGFNGSGKSTLLKIISGFLSPSKGKVVYNGDSGEVKRSEIYKTVSYSGPYLSSPDQLSIAEAVKLHFTFKDFIDGQNESMFYEQLELPVSKSARLSELSSGQQQRLLLGMAVMSDTEILLLDEPGSFLDLNAKEWLHGLLSKYASNRIVVIASNDAKDLVLCSQSIDISDYH